MTFAATNTSLAIKTVKSLLPRSPEFTSALAGYPSNPNELIEDFDVRKTLGRKGTSTLDRVTSLALACCEASLEQTGLPEHEQNTDRFGVVAGTTNASLKSVTDYSRTTLTETRPYLVNPILFPNTVMNCAAGGREERIGDSFGLGRERERLG